MNILLVSTLSSVAIGGATAYYRDLGDELCRRGHFVMGISRLREDVNLFRRYGETDVKNLPELASIRNQGWTDRIVFPKSRSVISALVLERLMWRPRLQSFAVRIFNNIYRRNFEQLCTGSIDVIHYTGTGAGMIGFTGMAIAKSRGAVFTAAPFVHPAEWGDGTLDVKFYNACDAVFVCTEIERQRLVEVGVENSRLIKTPLAPSGIVEANGLRFRRAYNLGDRPIVFFLARKKSYKGFHALREAMNKVIGELPHAILVAAGSDGEKPYPELPAANYLNLELDVGEEHRQLKADALAACNVFCMPSKSEAFGLVYAEAWAYGKPVIGGPAPALRELINEGVDGYLVSQNPEEIADRILRLLTDTKLCEDLGRSGFEKQRDVYNWDSVIKNHCDTWRRLVGKM